jgi:hypothetical protein
VDRHHLARERAAHEMKQRPIAHILHIPHDTTRHTRHTRHTHTPI